MVATALVARCGGSAKTRGGLGGVCSEAVVSSAGTGWVAARREGTTARVWAQGDGLLCRSGRSVYGRGERGVAVETAAERAGDAVADVAAAGRAAAASCERSVQGGELRC